MKGTKNEYQPEFDLPGAVQACVDRVETFGACTFPELADELSGRFGLPTDLRGDEVMTVGHRIIGHGATMTPMSDLPNLILWNCGSPELLAVIEAMLSQQPRVVIERTDVEHYQAGGMQLIEDYTDDGREEVLLPAIDYGQEIAADGYDTPHWVPVLFAWAG